MRVGTVGRFRSSEGDGRTNRKHGKVELLGLSTSRGLSGLRHGRRGTLPPRWVTDLVSANARRVDPGPETVDRRPTDARPSGVDRACGGRGLSRAARHTLRIKP